MTTIKEIRDEIARFKVEECYEVNDFIRLLDLLDKLAERIGHLEKDLSE